uniref:Uncharacterized protein n=1 Tax=Solanum lycopersicum TaxID=4081 RepID=A0A3Q7II39_SOLLC
MAIIVEGACHEATDSESLGSELKVKDTQHNQQIKEDEPGSSGSPLLSGKAIQLKQHVLN